LIKSSKKKIKTFKLGELYCGPGGLALGALKAKVRKNGITYQIKHEWASDYDEDTCNTYRKNICPDNPDSVICKNISEVNIENLPKIDCFAYGFPCNDFSIVGEHKGINGKFGPLYSYGVKVINVHKPKFIVAENVGGMSSANDGKAFERIINDLKNAGNGYEITSHKYKFEEYGVPQKRHRIILIGIDKTLNMKFKVPQITSERPITVRQALEVPPISENCFNQEFTRQSKTVIERLSYIKQGENIWQTDLPPHLQLNVKGAKLSQIYRRLHPNEPSYTITGSGGGGTHVYHWKECRALTNRERARLQTFPDNFEFIGSKESVRKQIGMAVPPKASEAIFQAILKLFAGINYDSI